jgi:hypothetical protein
LTAETLRKADCGEELESFSSIKDLRASWKWRLPSPHNLRRTPNGSKKGAKT